MSSVKCIQKDDKAVKIEHMDLLHLASKKSMINDLNHCKAYKKDVLEENEQKEIISFKHVEH